MMTIKVRLSLLLLGLVPLVVQARIGQQMYPLKERRAQQQLTLEEFNDIDLTFSDDSPPKVLRSFYLEVLETDGDLPLDPSLLIVQAALQDYILAELNATYGKNDQIDNVQATIVSQEAITRKATNAVPILGSRLETQVNITFDNEPSPFEADVESTLQQIMQDLTYLLTNLTAWADGDAKLSRVYNLTRVEVEDTLGIDPTPIETTPEEPVAEEGVEKSILIPVIISGVALIALIALFALRRKKETRVVPAPRNAQSIDVNVYMDEDSDNISYETSLADSPRKGQLRTKSVHRDLMTDSVSVLDDMDSPRIRDMDAGDTESDIFSGIESNMSPKHGGSRSVFSFLSGTTVPHSNTTEKKSMSPAAMSAAAFVGGSAVAAAMSPRSASATPKSRMSSLFAFSEGDEEASSIDGPSDEEESPKKVPFDEDTPTAAATTAANMEDDRILVLLSSDYTEYGPQSKSPKNNSKASPGTDFSHLFNDQSDRNGSGYDRSTSTNAHDESGYDRSTSTNAPSAIVPIALGASANSSNHTSDVHISQSSSSAFPMLRCGPKCACTHCDEDKPVVSTQDIKKELAQDEVDKEAGWNIVVVPTGGPLSSKSQKTANSANSTSLTPMRGNTKSRKVSTAVGYTSDPGPDTPGGKTSLASSTHSAQEIHLEWSDPNKSTKNAAIAAKFVASAADASFADSDASGAMGRRHAKSTTADGTSKYQSEAMHPLDWSITSYDGASQSGSEVSPRGDGLLVDKIHEIATSNKKKAAPKRRFKMAPTTPTTPKSAASSNISGLSPRSINSDGSTQSASRQLITDLVWLEKKIASANNGKAPTPTPLANSTVKSPRGDIDRADSMSFASNDGLSNSYDSTIDLASPKRSPRVGGMQAIVCRDCFAPPGKLKIVIHSTKDGPAVHTVKKGSSLEGHVFPGDLIISVDNVDTRSYTAEQVMKMMTSKTRFERKITVLHFEDETAK
jgi:hypothetical protein